MSPLTQKETETPAQTTPRRAIVPRHYAKETPDAFVVTAYVPGVNSSDVEASVDQETLTVFARRSWTAPEGWTAVYRETSQADYRFVLKLDHHVNRDALRAELQQGILTLTLPKAESIKPRRIEIQG